MNINKDEEVILKQVKTLVESIANSGKMPNTIEGINELWRVWNLTFRKREKVSNCASCRQTKFLQLKRTYDLYKLKDLYNKRVKKKSQQ